MKPETIIVQFVPEHVFSDTSKKETKYLVQFAGVSDKPSKLMRLQVWDQPFDTRKEAEDTLKEYHKKMKSGNFIIVSFKKK